jgi:hypothetical protein
VGVLILFVVLDNLELKNKSIEVNVIIMFGMAIGANIIGLLALRFIKHRPH